MCKVRVMPHMHGAITDVIVDQVHRHRRTSDAGPSCLDVGMQAVVDELEELVLPPRSLWHPKFLEHKGLVKQGIRGQDMAGDPFF